MSADLDIAPSRAGLADTSSGAATAASAPMPVPRLKPEDRDRSGEVLALLKYASAATTPVVTAAGTARTGSAVSAGVHKPTFKPQGTAQQPVVADARPATPAPAEQPSSSSPDPSIEALRRELRARDAVIASLLTRVEQLERHVVLNAAQLDRTIAGAAAPRPGAGTVTPGPGPSPGPAQQVAQAEPPAAQAGQPADQTADQAAPPPAAAPGQFEVDEEAVDRALERTLVQEGVLLLPLGQAEIDPSFSYTRRESDSPTFVTQNGTLFSGEQKVRRNEFESRTALRIGLPFDSQLEVDVPYEYVDQSTVTEVNFESRDSSQRWGSGLGDIRVGAAKTLLRENGGWWPDIIARAFWDTDTGKRTDNDVVLGSGFNEVGGGFSAVKRQDPLAFVGSAFYTKAFENDHIEPGDELSFSVGTFLAASPETSLRFLLNQSFVDDLKVDGDDVDGSDQVIGTVTIGASTLLGRNVLLDISADIGLTEDAPDYAARASVPIRFDLPVY